MTEMNLGQYALARQVRTDSMVPRQIDTNVGFQIKTDFYQREMLKHPHLSDFHSYPEFLHACLLEGDPDVIRYVPQPLTFTLSGWRKNRYKPDVYIERRNGRPQVVELKPEGEFDAKKRAILEAYCAMHEHEFLVISNETVLTQEQAALNWHTIVHRLVIARHMDTTIQEADLLSRITASSNTAIMDIINPDDRERTYLDEIALYRLLHRGQLQAALDKKPLGFDTQVTL